MQKELIINDIYSNEKDNATFIYYISLPWVSLILFPLYYKYYSSSKKIPVLMVKMILIATTLLSLFIQILKIFEVYKNEIFILFAIIIISISNASLEILGFLWLVVYMNLSCGKADCLVIIWLSEMPGIVVIIFSNLL